MLRSLIKAIGHIFSPCVCCICGTTLAQGEELLCTDCLLTMPRTHFHLSQFSELHKRLGPCIALDRAASWFFYSKRSRYAQLVIDTKYASRPRQGQTMGRMYASELLPSGFFSGIDALVPIPIYWIKRITRGYNQTEEICRGITSVTDIPMACILTAPVSHGIQSRHSIHRRMLALQGTFSTTKSASDYDGKHLLVVDDIFTTGATMTEALAQLHRACPSATLSILTLATAR